jgi:transposase
MSRSERRAALILQVRSGQLTAQEAARQLGISRQRYYRWERRALSALLTALEDQPKGRPKGKTDPEKAALLIRVQQLERALQLHQEREKLRQLLLPESGKKNLT